MPLDKARINNDHGPSPRSFNASDRSLLREPDADVVGAGVNSQPRAHLVTEVQAPNAAHCNVGGGPGRHEISIAEENNHMARAIQCQPVTVRWIQAATGTESWQRGKDRPRRVPGLRLDVHRYCPG